MPGAGSNQTVSQIRYTPHKTVFEIRRRPIPLKARQSREIRPLRFWAQTVGIAPMYGARSIGPRPTQVGFPRKIRKGDRCHYRAHSQKGSCQPWHTRDQCGPSPFKSPPESRVAYDGSGPESTAANPEELRSRSIPVLESKTLGNPRVTPRPPPRQPHRRRRPWH